jgi:hypothetical protein
VTVESVAAGEASPAAVGAGRLSAVARERLLWLAAFAAVAVWPLFLFAYPPFQDLPNHMARAYILLHPEDPLLARHFAISWSLVPDLAWDAFAVVVGHVLPLNVTLKIFLLLSLALTVTGLFVLNRVLVGQWTWAPLLVAPFLFNTGLTKGFLGFDLSVGMALLACAWWAAVDERHWRRRLAVAVLLSTLLFYAHLVAWACYGLFVLGTKLAELQAPLRQRRLRAALPRWTGRLLRDGLQALPPIALLVGSAVTGERGLSLAGRIGDFEQPIIRIGEIFNVIDTGTPIPSLFFLVALGPLALLVMLWRGRLRGVGIFALAIVMAVFFVVPDQIFETHMISWRLGYFAALLGLASTWPVDALTRRGIRVLLGWFLLGTLGLASWQAYTGFKSAAGQAEFSRLIALIPAGDTLFMEHARIDAMTLQHDQLGLYHVGALAVIERRVAVQSLFAFPGQQPIRYRDAALNNPSVNTRIYLEDLAGALKAQGKSVTDYTQNFDWAVMHGPKPADDREALAADRFAFVRQIGEFRLYCRSHAAPPGEGPALLCPDGLPPSAPPPAS